MTEHDSPAAQISAKFAGLGDWRADILAVIRRLTFDADSEVVEAVKWVKPSNPLGVPTWEHAGIICTGWVYKSYVKLTFAHGAALADPAGLFNASLGAERVELSTSPRAKPSTRARSWRLCDKQWR